MEDVVTAIGTANIAFIKYWGKRDDALILPTNSSVSMTLDEQLNTKTSVLFTKKLKEDKVYINGELQDIKGTEVGERLVCLDLLRERANDKRRALVVSWNSFPTASGLASSASGLATLAFTTAKALDLDISMEEISAVARRGSGSACRSLFGGVVKWNRGFKDDGSDSYAEQVVKAEYWPEFTDVIAILSESKKKISSRAGMKQTVKTSILYKSRMDYVEGAVAKLINAVRKKDFEAMGEIIMQDAMDMHATMLDTRPPIIYLNDNSKEIIQRVHELNESEGKVIAAYTFDAGPNPQIFTLTNNVSKVQKMLEELDYVKKVLKVKMGNGPRLLPEGESLIDKKGLKPAAR